MGNHSHWVYRPDHKGVGSDAGVERADFGTLGRSIRPAIEGVVPDDDQVRNEGDCIPTPLLRCSVITKGSKQTSEGHDQIGDNGHQNVGSAESCDKTEVKQDQGGGQRPVNVSGPEDLTVHVCEGVRDVVVGMTNADVPEGNAMSRRHCEVGEGANDGNEGCQDMVNSSGL